MKRLFSSIILVVALACVLTAAAFARHTQRGEPGELRMVEGVCTCVRPGEMTGPPCGGECILDHH